MKKFGYLLLLLTFLSSCFSARVFVDYDTQYDVSSAKTFAFYKPGIDSAQISDLDKKRILRSLETTMESKGYQKASQADLLISFSPEESTTVEVYNQQWGFGWGFGFNPWGWNPWMGNNTMVNTANEGALRIDILESKNRQLVWQGSAEGALKKTQNPETRQKMIDRYVQAILDRMPSANQP